MKKRAILAFFSIIVASIPLLIIVPYTSSKNLVSKRDAARVQKSSQPNILFILADDLDKEAIAYMPNLQALLVKQGLSFQNAFVSVSLCCPSRSTILCGNYSHNTGIKSNGPIKGGFQTFYKNGLEKSTVATWLQSGGYETALIGKYLNGYPDTRLVPKTYIPQGWTQWYSPVTGKPQEQYNYVLNENGTLVSYGSASEDYGTDVYIQKATHVIQSAAAHKKPFFIYLALNAPHTPATPAPRHLGLYNNKIAPRTPSYNEADVSDKPNYIQSLPLLTSKQKNSLDILYRRRLESLQAVDEGIKTLYETLAQAKQLDNTYIFFTSDNGFHFGQHRTTTGKSFPYQEDVRIPLIVRGPNLPRNQTRSHIVGNTDFAPTFADLANISVPDTVDGRSFSTLLSKNPPPKNFWRQSYLLEYWPVGVETSKTPQSRVNYSGSEAPDLDQLRSFSPRYIQVPIPEYHGLQTSTYSYIEYSTGEKELYNLKVDAYQLNNIASEQPRLVRTFSDRLALLKQCKGKSCKEIEDLK
ncbi:MAG TPA: sulfatase [Stenomitos sp.]